MSTADSAPPKGGPSQELYASREASSMSMDSMEERASVERQPGDRPRPRPRPPPLYAGPHGNMMYPPLPPPHSRFPPRKLQSVVTASFSVEDERDEAMRESMARRRRQIEQRMEAEDMEERDDREEWEAAHSAEGSRPFHSAHGASPRYKNMPPSGHRPPYVHRTYSSPIYYTPPEPLKRNFFHHSRPMEGGMGGHLPPDFMPPKRLKLSGPGQRQEHVITPRRHDAEPPGMRDWFGRVPSWESDARAMGPISRSHSFPPPIAWSGPPHGLSPMGLRKMPPPGLAQVSPGSETEDSPRAWRHGHTSPWGSPPQHAVRFWDSPRSRDDVEAAERSWVSPRDEPPRRDPHIMPPSTYDMRYDEAHYRGSRGHGDSRSPVASREKVENSFEASEQRMELAPLVTSPLHGAERKSPKSHPSDKPMILLALPQDRIALSETLCVVRENIEVFTATQTDVDAPAPGRKHAVVVGQIGLRCIHCRHTTRCSDRVKRAVCYPSSIKRIYRTVIDMKLDHFSQCKFVPPALKARLDELKAIHTRSTGTTMQYFIRAAHTLGMEDGASGVRMSESSMKDVEVVDTPPLSKLKANVDGEMKEDHEGNKQRTSDASTGSSSRSMDMTATNRSDSMMSTDSFDTTGSSDPPPVVLEKFYVGLVSLSLPEDKTALSPLRCFLREQVCAFSASEEDIAVRAPTTFSIAVGQVGIGCIHCLKQPAKLRSNRAVCFPFSIGRIYQSVADIQRFHFGECKMMPADVREQFLALQSASSKGSKGLATRQYWVTSARKIGLVDTPQGIRFGRDPAQPESSKAFSLDILAQVAFSVTTASRQLVLPEDKPHIAEFLYVVMEQLQPCRFTEADRNKRRLKDVGCIGVECKHCAGQVDSRKFFWSSVSAVESNFVSVHTHMLECRLVPDALKTQLADLKMLRKEQTAALKTGSQKAFFARVWQRLHEDYIQQDQEDAKQGNNDSTLTTTNDSCLASV